MAGGDERLDDAVVGKPLCDARGGAVRPLDASKDAVEGEALGRADPGLVGEIGRGE